MTVIAAVVEVKEAAALKKRIRELEQENEILKRRQSTHPRQEKLKRYEFIDKEKANHSVKILCRLMEVSATAYYAFAREASYRETTAQKSCREQVSECFYFNRRLYGTRRIAKQLKIGRAAVRTAMKWKVCGRLLQSGLSQRPTIQNTTGESARICYRIV